MRRRAFKNRLNYALHIFHSVILLLDRNTYFFLFPHSKKASNYMPHSQAQQAKTNSCFVTRWTAATCHRTRKKAAFRTLTTSLSKVTFFLKQSRLEAWASGAEAPRHALSSAAVLWTGWAHCQKKKPPKLKSQARQLLDSNSLDWSSPAVLNLLIWGLSHSDKVSGLYPVKKKKKLSSILKKVSEILEFLESKQLCLCKLFLTQVSVLKSKEQCY